MMKLLKKTSLKIAILCTLYSVPSFAKFDMSTGLFSLDVTTNEGSSSISNLGAYQLNYASAINEDFEVNIGYTLLMSQIVGGDLMYGFDLGLNYFPFTDTTVITGASPTGYLEVNPIWRPFVGGSFHQRQLQSTRTNYAGFSIIAGAERATNYSFDLKAFFRLASLAGPSQSATEITVMFGITFP